MSDKVKVPLKFYSLLPAFKRKLYLPGLENFSIQRIYNGKSSKDPGFYPESRGIGDEDFYDHFYFNPSRDWQGLKGSLAFRPVFGEDRVLWVVVDCDNKTQRDIGLNLICPVYDKYGIDYIIEHGGDSNDRCHIWFTCDARLYTVNKFMGQVLEEAGTNTTVMDEIYPTTRPKNVIRLFGGPHLKRNNTRYPLEYKGVVIYDAAEQIETFVNVKQHTDVELKGMIKEVKLKPKVLAVKAQGVDNPFRETRHFYYHNMNMELPVENIPEKLIPMAKNCQAFNRSLQDVVEENGLEVPGGNTHMRGLFLHGIAEYNDIRFHNNEGKVFLEFLVDNFRFRDAGSHNWARDPEKIENPERLFTSCDGWQNYFPEYCRGCPFQHKIRSPKSFIYGKPVTKTAIRKVNLTTTEWIRNNTFPKFIERVEELVDTDTPKSLLLASPQGSGKSKSVDDIAISLARRGKFSLIAVPTAKLAMEHKERIQKMGGHAFVLMSHKNVFDHLLKDKMECPSYKEISEMRGVGVASSAYKTEYCIKCPLIEECHYYNQYAEVLEPKHRIVIIQHAHLQCEEVMFNLMKKPFACLFIDETFIDNLINFIKPSKSEIELLKAVVPTSYTWRNRLADWMEGKEDAHGWLNPKYAELQQMHKLYKGMDLAWTLPQYLLYYNQRKTCHRYAGIEVVSEIPDIPVKVYTDATPPRELLEMLTGGEEIEVWGEDEVLDMQAIHPENKVIQVLDGSTSNKAMEKQGKLDIILHQIGHIITEKFLGKKVLITLYAKYEDLATKFFSYHYPEVYKEIARKNIKVYHMVKGVNDFQHFDVQFLVAGVYFSGKNFADKVYRYKEVINHYRNKKNLPPWVNMFPHNLPDNMRIEYADPEPVSRIEKVGNNGYVFEYPGFFNFKPKHKIEYLIDKFNTGNTQQSNRMRFFPDKPRTLIIFNNLPMPSIQVTHSVLEEDLMVLLDSLFQNVTNINIENPGSVVS